MKPSYDAIVIGGGHNGLVSAITLAQKGKKVAVFEKNPFLGGLAAKREFHPGFFSNGLLQHTNLLRPNVLKDLKIELEWNQTASPTYIPDTTGKGINFYDDPHFEQSELAHYFAGDAQKYVEFKDFIKRVSNPVLSFLESTPAHFDKMSTHEKWTLLKTSLKLRFLGKDDMLELLRIPPMCVADWLNEWFECEKLKASLALLAVSGTFNGPWSPGTAFNLLVNLVMGHTNLKRGPLALIDSLEKRARSLGVSLNTSHEVIKILVENERATGVELRDGKKYFSPHVFSSIAPSTTFLELINSQLLDSQFTHNLKNYRSRGTTAIINLALKNHLVFKNRPKLLVEFAHIVENLDQLEKSFDAIKYNEMPIDPALQLFCPSMANPALAPSGHSVISIMVHFVPYHLNGGWSDHAKEVLRKIVVDKIERYCGPLEICGEEILSPQDLEQHFGLIGGNIHHGEHSIDQVLVRPIPECARFETPIKGIFLCGGGSFPGGNLTALPGYLAAKSVL